MRNSERLVVLAANKGNERMFERGYYDVVLAKIELKGRREYDTKNTKEKLVNC